MSGVEPLKPEAYMQHKIEPGMIGFSNNKKGGWLIRFFTRSKITHSFVITFNVNGIVAVEEASASVQIVPFESHYQGNPNYSYFIYRIIADYVTPEDIQNALTKTFEQFAGVKYGWLQLLWFPYRWFKVSAISKIVVEHPVPTLKVP